jgi:uncharacterized protein YgiM (DUF1202 family)
MLVLSSRKFWVFVVLLLFVLIIPSQVFAGVEHTASVSNHGQLSVLKRVEEPDQPVAVVNTGALNVRSGPDVSFSRVTVVYNGQPVVLLGHWATNNWVKIRLYSGVEGWVNSAYLNTSVPVSELPVLGGTPPPVKPEQPIYQATAVVITGALNVRTGPGISYGVATVVRSGDQVVLLGRNSTGSWVKIKTSTNVEGWVNASLVSTSVPVNELPVVDGSPPEASAVVTVSAANVRTGPGGQYDVVAILYQGQAVSLLGRSSGSNWLYVRLGNGQEGWIKVISVQVNVPIASLPVIEPGAPSNAAIVDVSWLNVRYGPGTSFGAFTVLHKGQVVSMIGRAANSTWVQVRLPSGAVGWVNSNYLLGKIPITDLPITYP